MRARGSPRIHALLALQVARFANPAQLILVGTREQRLAMGKPLGASHIINVREQGAMARLHDLLEPAGADVVIECAGTPDALQLAPGILNRRGRVAVEGTHEPGKRLTISSAKVFGRGTSLIGVSGWLTIDYTWALQLLTQGLMQVKPLVIHVFPLDEWELAFEMITVRESEAIKVEFAF